MEELGVASGFTPALAPDISLRPRFAWLVVAIDGSGALNGDAREVPQVEGGVVPEVLVATFGISNGLSPSPELTPRVTLKMTTRVSLKHLSLLLPIRPSLCFQPGKVQRPHRETSTPPPAGLLSSPIRTPSAPAEARSTHAVTEVSGSFLEDGKVFCTNHRLCPSTAPKERQASTRKYVVLARCNNSHFDVLTETDHDDNLMLTFGNIFYACSRTVLRNK